MKSKIIPSTFLIKEKYFKLLVIIFIIALFIRLLNINFPVFSLDEARVAYRGYTLITNGTDELGRKLPLLFNSSTDYQFSLVSYLTALGELIFGKNDFGARIPFILIGSLIIFLIYKLANLFDERKIFGLYSALLLCFSPILIFFSKIPNEFILMTFLNLSLIYLLTKKDINLGLIFLNIILLLLTSKIALFTLIPLTLFTLLIFKKQKFSSKEKFVSLAVIILVGLTMLWFIKIPQAVRSLLENNLLIFHDISIQNAIEGLRTQGINNNFLFILDKIFFNKIHFLVIGAFHWLSHFQPRILFGQFDSSGMLGFIGMGAFAKLAIIPFLIGILNIIKNRRPKDIGILLYVLVITIPCFFIFPRFELGIIALAVPFLILITALGLINIKPIYSLILMIFIVGELLFNLTFIEADIRNSTNTRPEWVKDITLDISTLSSGHDIVISDRLLPDPLPLIGWYTNLKITDLKIDYPYRFIQMQSQNIKILTSESQFYNCTDLKSSIKLFISGKDFDREHVKKIWEKSYINGEGKTVGYLVTSDLCIK